MPADVADTLAEWSTTPADNMPTGSTAISSNLDDNLRTMQAVTRTLMSAGTIASAATIDLSTVNDAHVTVTGNTGPVTSLGSVSAGIRRILTFAGTPTLTHNGTSLILPGAANITAVAGDTAELISLGSGNWKCLWYHRGTVVLPATGTLATRDGAETLTNKTLGATVFSGAITGGQAATLGATSVTSLTANGNVTVNSGALTKIYRADGMRYGTVQQTNNGLEIGVNNAGDQLWLGGGGVAGVIKVSSNNVAIDGALAVGSGATGLVLRPHTGGSFGAIYSSNVTPAVNNYMLMTDGAAVSLNAPTTLTLEVGGATKVTVSSTSFVVGSGAANAQLTLDGSSMTATGAAITFKRAGTQTGFIGHKSLGLGAGHTESDLMYFVENGLGHEFYVNGAASPSVRMPSTGGLVVTGPLLLGTSSQFKKLTLDGSLYAINNGSFYAANGAADTSDAFSDRGNNSGDAFCHRFIHTAGGGWVGYRSDYGNDAGSPNTGFYPYYYTRNATARFYVSYDGNVYNINNSYGAISDPDLKTDIVLAGSQWNDVKTLAANVVKFRRTDDVSGRLQLGFVSRDVGDILGVRSVSPGLVTEYADGGATGSTTDSVMYSVAYMKAFKALGEALLRVENLEAANDDLRNRLAALEAAQ